MARERRGVATGTTRPLTPSTTSSGLPPQSVTTGATPYAIASINDRASPSRFVDGSTNTAQAAVNAGASLR